MSVAVPDVTGLTQGAAETALVAAGLVLGDVTTANSCTVDEDLVISQDPAAGEDVDAGSTVDLVISLGPLEPTGVLGIAVDGLRKCVAGSATFQSAVDAEDAAAALAFVHAWRMESDIEPPFAFVGPAHEVRDRVSTAGAYPERGGVLLALVLPLRDTDDDLEAFYAFDNIRDGVISDIAAIAEASGFLHIRSIELDAENYGLWSATEKRARGAEGIQAWHTITWGF